jgi:hypothetical protein
MNIDPQAAAIALVALMALITMLAFAHAKQSLIQQRDEVASRARVVREMRSIRIHRPRHIIDADGLDRSFWKDL